MLTVARYYPAHDDISLLAAEAAMDTLPWDYWEPDKQSAKPRLGDAIRWSRRCSPAMSSIRKRRTSTST
jgi:hypothetical protein